MNFFLFPLYTTVLHLGRVRLRTADTERELNYTYTKSVESLSVDHKMHHQRIYKERECDMLICYFYISLPCIIVRAAAAGSSS